MEQNLINVELSMKSEMARKVSKTGGQYGLIYSLTTQYSNKIDRTLKIRRIISLDTFVLSVSQ